MMVPQVHGHFEAFAGLLPTFDARRMVEYNHFPHHEDATAFW